MTQRLFRVEYESGELVVRISPKKLRLLPQPTREHLREANKEMLLAFRSCLDAALDVLKRPEKGEASTGRTRIPVEVVD